MFTPILHSQRLTLRPFHFGEAECAYENWFSQPNVAKYMFWDVHSNLQETQEWLDFELTQLNDLNWYRFAVEIADTRRLIGSLLLYYEEEINNWEVAYHFSQKYWNQGYATESLKCVVSFAREKLNLKNIAARYALENAASGRVLKKTGFQKEQTITYHCRNGSVFLEGVLCRLLL